MVHHLDFYRLNEEQLSSFDWQDYLGEPESLTVIEWPERLNKLPVKVKRIDLAIINQNNRKANLSDNWDANGK